MKSTSLVLVVVLFAVQFSAFSQTKPRSRPARPAPEKPTTVEMATSDSGKRIELHSDGTWKYADAASTTTKPPTSNRPATSRTTILSLEAGLVFQSGDIKPVARTEFHILDESLSKILRDAGVQPRSGGGNSDHDIVFSYGLAKKYGAESNVPSGVNDAIKKHIVQTTTSDFGGKAKFNPVPQGTYYVFAIASTPKGFVIWNVKVELTSAEASITLDQNNAEIAI